MKRKRAVKTLMGFGKSRNEANQLLDTYRLTGMSNLEICEYVGIEIIIEKFPEVVEMMQQKLNEWAETIFAFHEDIWNYKMKY